MLENTLENTIEQKDLAIPADAVELSMDDLEEVTGAWGGGGSCFSGFGSCFTAFKFSVNFNECFEFFTFGSSCGWGSCWN
jgi:hypothetical protein